MEREWLGSDLLPFLSCLTSKSNIHRAGLLLETLKLVSNGGIFFLSSLPSQFYVFTQNLSSAGVEVKFKNCHYPVLVHPSEIQELNRVDHNGHGITVGAAISLPT